MTGDVRIYESTDSADQGEDEKQKTAIPVEFLYSQHPPGLPLVKLTLKVGAPIILFRNLFHKEDLYNGTRLIIYKLRYHYIETKILNEEFDQQLRVIPRIILNSGQDDD